MAQRDQIRGFLRRHNAGDTRDTDDIAFLVAAGDDKLERFRGHRNVSLGDGATRRDGFAANINHMRPAAVIEMGQFRHNDFVGFVALNCRGRASARRTQ